MPTRSEKEAARKKKFRRQQTEDAAEIGPPELTDEQRAEGDRLRELCRNSLLNFNIHCFPNSTGLRPFGQVQVESIAHDESIILNGGQLTKAEPRSYGKTSRGCNAAMWAVLYGYRRMVPIFSANLEKSSGSPTMIPMRRMRGRRLPIGCTFSVSIIATGMIGTLASRAIRAIPVRPR